MINEVLGFLCSELNIHLRNALSLTEDRAIVSAIVNRDGSFPVDTEDKVIFTLVNIEEELPDRNLPGSKLQNGSFSDAGTPLHLNLSLLCPANFNDHTEALKFISHTISFFHNKNVFTGQDTPWLPGDLEKIIVELQNMTHEEGSNMWRKLGADYMPSVVYKVRVLMVPEPAKKDMLPILERDGK